MTREIRPQQGRVIDGSGLSARATKTQNLDRVGGKTPLQGLSVVLHCA